MAAANPYMRDALIDGMQEDLDPTTGQPKAKINQTGTSGAETTQPVSTAPAAPDGKTDWLTTVKNMSPTVQGIVLDANGNPKPEQAAAGGASSATNPNSAVPQGANTNKSYAGFNTQRAQDPSKSAKDAFYAASQQATWMPNSKDEAGQWFNQFIKDALIKQGYQVDWVEGDKAFVRTRENPQGEEIDFLQQAGAPDAALAWQSNMAGMNTAGGGTGSTGITSPTLNPALSNSNVLDQINAQIASLMGAGLNLDQIRELINTGAGGEQGTGMTPQV